MADHLLPERVKAQIYRIRKSFRERRVAVAKQIDDTEQQSINQFLAIVKDALDVPEHYELADDNKLVEPTDEG